MWQSSARRTSSLVKVAVSPEVCKELGITDQTYYRWRQKYGGMDPQMAKYTKDLEQENLRLKKLVADQALSMEILKEAARPN